MDVIRIGKGEPAYPVVLQSYLGDEAPDSIAALGSLEILRWPKLALFCSIRCPGRLIVQTYDLAHCLREAGMAVIGGFHSPMEKECLGALLRGPAPVILCPARRVGATRIPVEYRRPLEEGRLLILSPFDDGERRATVDGAVFRNRFVAALADRVFVAHAAPSGKTEQSCRELLAWGKLLYTFSDPSNRNLLELGAEGTAHGQVPGEAGADCLQQPANH